MSAKMENCQNTRLLYLDNLRVFLVFNVVLDHTALIFLPYDLLRFSYNEGGECIPETIGYLSLISAFSMPLYLFLSGYFLPLSYERNSISHFVKNKLIRLGIPLIWMLSTTYLINGHSFPGPLWYLELLLLLSFVYVLFRKMNIPIRIARVKVSTSIILFSFLTFIVSYLTFSIRKIYPYSTWICIGGIYDLEPAHYPQYILGFIGGVWAYRTNMLQRMSDRVGSGIFMVGIILVILYFLYGVSFFYYTNSRLLSFHETLLDVFFSLGLLWCFRRYFFTQTHFMRWCSKHAYGVYVVHWFVLIIVERVANKVISIPILKMFVIGIVGLVLSFFVSWILRKIPGLNKVL